MDRFEELSLFGRLFPRISRVVLLVAMVFFTHQFASTFMSVAEEHGQHLARELESALHLGPLPYQSTAARQRSKTKHATN